MERYRGSTVAARCGQTFSVGKAASQNTAAIGRTTSAATATAATDQRSGASARGARADLQANPSGMAGTATGDAAGCKARRAPSCGAAARQVIPSASRYISRMASSSATSSGSRRRSETMRRITLVS